MSRYLRRMMRLGTVFFVLAGFVGNFFVPNAIKALDSSGLKLESANAQSSGGSPDCPSSVTSDKIQVNIVLDNSQSMYKNTQENGRAINDAKAAVKSAIDTFNASNADVKLGLTVFDLTFRGTFGVESKPYSEVATTLNDLKKPTVKGTVIRKGMEMGAQNLLNWPVNNDRKRVMIVISDGLYAPRQGPDYRHAFTTDSFSPVSANPSPPAIKNFSQHLKNLGITIYGIHYVGDRQINERNQRTGKQIMQAVASGAQAPYFYSKTQPSELSGVFSDIIRNITKSASVCGTVKVKLNGQLSDLPADKPATVTLRKKDDSVISSTAVSAANDSKWIFPYEISNSKAREELKVVVQWPPGYSPGPDLPSVSTNCSSSDKTVDRIEWYDKIIGANSRLPESGCDGNVFYGTKDAAPPPPPRRVAGTIKLIENGAVTDNHPPADFREVLYKCLTTDTNCTDRQEISNDTTSQASSVFDLSYRPDDNASGYLIEVTPPADYRMGSRDASTDSSQCDNIDAKQKKVSSLLWERLPSDSNCLGNTFYAERIVVSSPPPGGRIANSIKYVADRVLMRQPNEQPVVKVTVRFDVETASIPQLTINEVLADGFNFDSDPRFEFDGQSVSLSPSGNKVTHTARDVAVGRHEFSFYVKYNGPDGEDLPIDLYNVLVDDEPDPEQCDQLADSAHFLYIDENGVRKCRQISAGQITIRTIVNAKVTNTSKRISPAILTRASVSDSPEATISIDFTVTGGTIPRLIIREKLTNGFRIAASPDFRFDGESRTITPEGDSFEHVEENVNDSRVHTLSFKVVYSGEDRPSGSPIDIVITSIGGNEVPCADVNTSAHVEYDINKCKQIDAGNVEIKTVTTPPPPPPEVVSRIITYKRTDINKLILPKNDLIITVGVVVQENSVPGFILKERLESGFSLDASPEFTYVDHNGASKSFSPTKVGTGFDYGPLNLEVGEHKFSFRARYTGASGDVTIDKIDTGLTDSDDCSPMRSKEVAHVQFVLNGATKCKQVEGGSLTVRSPAIVIDTDITLGRRNNPLSASDSFVVDSNALVVTSDTTNGIRLGTQAKRSQSRLAGFDQLREQLSARYELYKRQGKTRNLSCGNGSVELSGDLYPFSPSSSDIHDPSSSKNQVNVWVLNSATGKCDVVFKAPVIFHGEIVIINPYKNSKVEFKGTGTIAPKDISNSTFVYIATANNSIGTRFDQTSLVNGVIFTNNLKLAEIDESVPDDQVAGTQNNAVIITKEMDWPTRIRADQIFGRLPNVPIPKFIQQIITPSGREAP